MAVKLRHLFYTIFAKIAKFNAKNAKFNAKNVRVII